MNSFELRCPPKDICFQEWGFDWSEEEELAVFEFIVSIGLDFDLPFKSKNPLDLQIDLGIFEDGSEKNPSLTINMSDFILYEIENVDNIGGDLSKLKAIRSELAMLVDKIDSNIVRLDEEWGDPNE